MRIPNPVMAIKNGVKRARIISQVRRNIREDDIYIRTHRPSLVENFFKTHPKILEELVKLKIPTTEIAEVFASAKSGEKIEWYERELERLIEQHSQF